MIKDLREREGGEQLLMLEMLIRELPKIVREGFAEGGEGVGGHFEVRIVVLGSFR